MPEETDVHCIPACMLSWSPPLQAKYALPRGGGPAPRTTRIFVARIPPMVSDVEFRQYFERFGQVQVSQHPLFLYQLLVHDSRNSCLSSPSCVCYGISNLSWCKGPFRQSTDPIVLLWLPCADWVSAFAGRLHCRRMHPSSRIVAIGFVTFASSDSVEAVMSTPHSLNGQELAIDRATPKDKVCSYPPPPPPPSPKRTPSCFVKSGVICNASERSQLWSCPYCQDSRDSQCNKLL